MLRSRVVPTYIRLLPQGKLSESNPLPGRHPLPSHNQHHHHEVISILQPLVLLLLYPWPKRIMGIPSIAYAKEEEKIAAMLWWCRDIFYKAKKVSDSVRPPSVLTIINLSCLLLQEAFSKGIQKLM